MVPADGQKVPVVLTIAGFDPSSGAGVSADLKTIAAFACYGMACISALTVQNTQGVFKVETVEADLVRETLNTLAADTGFAAIKVGMLASGDIVRQVADFLEERKPTPIVLDPVIRSSSGTVLLADSGIQSLVIRLLPLATVVTPNLSEAEALSGQPVRDLSQMKAAALELRMMGAKNVVVTGGHLAENTDLLRLETGEEIEIRGPRIESTSTHGTGCSFSTAIACGLANGENLENAARNAKEYVRKAIASAYPVGNGTGPLNHLFRLK